MRLVGERNDWYHKYVGSVNEPDLLLDGVEPDPHGPPTQRRMELNAIDGPELMEVTSDLAMEAPGSGAESEVGVVRAESEVVGVESSGLQQQQRPPVEDGTARQIMQLLQEIQNPRARATAFLGQNPCIPFFYRPDEHDEVKILVV
ncbi:hypothetical protein AAFF_G00112030 [Aldrovandia affinis]|uniref:Uncharacterized protein n=1 Tax=Aldrovandia affinis TaxID=143900 RepID=A0AAD7WAK9_9TELE|nr:hypothetical protein AAFF_G00112030 [Aldrovandia affinis]